MLSTDNNTADVAPHSDEKFDRSHTEEARDPSSRVHRAGYYVTMGKLRRSSMLNLYVLIGVAILLFGALTISHYIPDSSCGARVGQSSVKPPAEATTVIAPEVDRNNATESNGETVHRAKYMDYQGPWLEGL